MDSIIEKAYAKINLYLDVYKIDAETGMHDLMTVMQLVELYDEVHLTLNDTQTINLDCDKELNINPNQNLAYKAAELFYKNLQSDIKTGVDIKIIKKIPVAAGLGGGSADAAAVLRGLNRIYNTPFNDKRLCDLGAEIGADVPFCILGGAYACSGQGKPEIPLRGIHNYHILIAIGEEKTSTKEQFQKLDKMYNAFGWDFVCRPTYGRMIAAYSSGRCMEAFSLSVNVFENLYGTHSSVQIIKDMMYDCGAYFAQLSGSGPAVIGVFPDRFILRDAQELLEEKGYKCYPCLPIDASYNEIYEGNPLRFI